VIVVTHGRLDGLNFSNPFGAGLAIGSAFLWALFWILNVKDKREEINKLFFNFLFGFIYILILNLCLGNLVLPGIKGLLGSIWVGLFEMGITFVVWLKALRYSSTTAKVTNLIFLSPFLSLGIIHFVVGETILTSTFIGLSMIIGGILLQKLK
jgi:drug/metabolite transporter (DMT)-like permease